MRIFATSAFRVFVAKPRSYRVRRSIKPGALFASAIFTTTLVPLALVAAITAAPSLSFALTVAALIVVVSTSAAHAASGAASGAIVVALGGA